AFDPGPDSRGVGEFDLLDCPAQDESLRLNDIAFAFARLRLGPLQDQQVGIELRVRRVDDHVRPCPALWVPGADFGREGEIQCRGSPTLIAIGRAGSDADDATPDRGSHLAVGQDHAGIPVSCFSASSLTQTRWAPESASTGRDTRAAFLSWLM